MPRSAPSRPAEQRRAILEAAGRAFADSGYASATMSALATRCGVSKGLLYHYYPSKDAMLFDLVSSYTSRLVGLAEEVAARRLPPVEHLEALVRAFLAEYRTSRDRHIALLHDVKFLPERERAEVLEQERRVVRVFASAIEAASGGAAGPREASVLAMMLFGMINWTFTWLDPQGRLSYADFAEAVLALLRGGMTAAAARLAGGAAPSARPQRPRRKAAGTPSSRA